MVTFWRKRNTGTAANQEATVQEAEELAKHKDESIHTLDIYGLKSFFDAKSKAAKAFWLILLIVCTGIFIQQLYKTITNYINSPVVSTYTIKTVKAMDFPVVYICPTSFISFQTLNKTPSAEYDAIALKEEMGHMWDFVDFLATGNLTGDFPHQGKEASHVDPPSLRKLRRPGRRYNQTGRSDRDAEQFFKNVTVPLKDHVRYCEFRSFSFEKLPCENITTEVLDPEHGKCYAIDVGQRQQTVQSQALIVTFNVRSNWYPKSPAVSPMFNGVYVSIQRKLNVDKSGESIILNPGTYYRVDLSAQHQLFESFQHPYPQVCLDNDSYPDFQVYNVSYTQQSCLYDCAASAMKKACNCVPPVDSRFYADGILNTTKFCKYADADCVENIAKSSDAVNEIQSCRDKCKRPCEDWRYSVRATSMDLYKYGFDAGIPVHDLIFILVSFSQMEYTEFKQDDSKTPDQMIADIGGEAGLWIGAGMMTLLQMPLFAVAVCGSCCKNGCRKSAKKTGGKKKEAQSNNTQ